MFSWFNDLRMGTKLLGAFLVLVVIVGGVLGGLSYFNLMNINKVLLEITDQRVPSVKNATTVERFALRTILDEKQYLLSANDFRVDGTKFQQSAMDNIDQIIVALDAVDAVAAQYNDQDLLSKSQEVRTVTLEYKDLYNQGVAKLAASAELAATMNGTGTQVVDLASAFFNSKVNQTDEQSLAQIPVLVDIWDTALQIRLNQNKYMLYHDPQFYTALEEGITKLGTLYADLQKITTNTSELKQITTARTATDTYFQAAQDWVKNDNDLTDILAQMNTIGQQVQQNAIAAEDSGWTAAEASKATSSVAIANALNITLIAVVVALLLGVILGLVISRSITVPLGIAVNATKLLSTGDLARDLSEKEKDKVRLRKDEIGDIGKAVDGLINYMQEMGQAAVTIAQNDLTAAVSPRSSKDELGNAFSRMITGLRKTLSELAENAKNLSMASGQLAQAAGQAGQATNQISTTVQQVAKGTQDQAQSVTRTAVSVEQMSRAINGVAKGAQEQSLAVTKVSNITLQMTDAIQQVSGECRSGDERFGWCRSSGAQRVGDGRTDAGRDAEYQSESRGIGGESTGYGTALG